MKIKQFFKSVNHESLLISVLLALVGGFLDIYTYLLKGNVFANAQTGNMVLMGLKLANKDYLHAFYYLVPILAFFIGILVSEYIKHVVNQNQYLEWQHLIIIIETFILAIIALFFNHVSNLICNATIGFVCSLQVNTFKITNGLPYASTMCTGNLRSASQQLSIYLFDHNKRSLLNCINYLIIIVSFIIGAIIATILINIFSQYSLLFCCLILIIVFLMLIYQPI